MSAKRSLERVLRDNNDASGQGIRSWLITRDGDHLTIARSEHSDWVSVAVADVPQLVADLQELAAAT